jgi:hypothetical protein
MADISALRVLAKTVIPESEYWVAKDYLDNDEPDLAGNEIDRWIQVALDANDIPEKIANIHRTELARALKAPGPRTSADCPGVVSPSTERD